MDEHVTEKTAQLLQTTHDSEVWYVDSGATSHFTNNLAGMHNISVVDLPVGFGQGSSRATALGSVKLTLKGNLNVTFSNVLYVPGIKANLLSTEKLKAKGLFYRNDNDTLFVKDGDRTHVVANVVNKAGLPQLQLADATREQAHVSSHELHTSKADIKTWHDRMGHFPQTKTDLVIKATQGVEIVGSKNMDVCHDCKTSDAKRIISRVTTSRPKTPLTHWNIDVVTVSSNTGVTKSYFTLMTCATSLTPRVGFHPTKDGAYKHVKDLIQWVETQTESKIKVKTIHIDGGREFGGNKMTELCADKGIELVVTTPKNSEANGRAEVSNHLVCSMARKLLRRGRMGKKHWQAAIEAAVYIIKRTPSPALDGKSPYQVVIGKIPYVGNLRTFGCTAFVLDQDVARGDKFADRAQIGRLTGFEGNNIYRVYLNGKTVRSVNVRFDEKHFTDDSDQLEPEPLVEINLGGNEDEDVHQGGVKLGGVHTPEGAPSGGEKEDEATPPENNNTPAINAPTTAGLPVEPTPEPRRSGRNIKPTEKAKSALFAAIPDDLDHTVWTHRALLCLTDSINNTSEVIAPKSYEEAISSPQAARWIIAMNKEVESLHENRTWKLVELPPAYVDGVKTVIFKGRWVYKVKTDVDGKAALEKARWVLKGFSQRPGLDYDDTFAATTKATTIKLLLALIAHHDLEAKQYDVMTAFLYALIKDRKIYVEQPHGYVQYAKNGSALVCLLLKSLYGLKQAPFLWFEELTTFLKSKGFKPLQSDPCIFQHFMTNAIIAVYVDDLISAAKDMAAIEHTEKLLTDRFKMKCLGNLSFYLGCRIMRSRAKREIYLIQDAYVEQLLEKYNVESLNPIDTPMAPGSRLTKAPDDYAPTSNLLNEYQSLVGRLMWPSLQTRPDITFAVAQLSRHLVSPTTDHLNAGKRVLRYLKGTSKYGIIIKGGSGQDFKVEGYTDSSYADNRDDGTSTGAYVFHINGSLISWKCVKQRTVSLSSTEAEWNAAVTTTQEAAYIAALCVEFKLIEKVTPIKIYADNLGQIALSKKTGVDGRTKHMNTRLHWLREQINNGLIAFSWVPSKGQAADGLTKALTFPLHELFRELVGLVDLTPQLVADSRRE